MLQVTDLSINFTKRGRKIRAVRGVSFAISAGQKVALVGESGCGKSVTALAIMQLLASNGHLAGGQVCFEGQDLTKLPAAQLAALRGAQIAMIFQEPASCLNPLLSIGEQLAEAISPSGKAPKAELKKRAIQLLTEVEIPAPKQRLQDYPHQLSGGMAQRVMIAMALAGAPRLLIADEPTTALDVTVQAQILDLLEQTSQERNLAILLITHDLGVVAEIADRVLVMYAGQIVEEQEVCGLFAAPRHPYTRGLLDSTPALNMGKKRLPAIAGNLPDPSRAITGCAFAPRCHGTRTRCQQESPELRTLAGGAKVACFYPLKEKGSSE